MQQASIEAVYTMIKSIIRRPHYYALVRLLNLEQSTKEPPQAAKDAYELYGEGKNWLVLLFYMHDLAISRSPKFDQ